MTVKELIDHLSAIHNQAAEVVLDDSELDAPSLLTMYQEVQNGAVHLSSYRPPDEAWWAHSQW